MKVFYFIVGADEIAAYSSTLTPILKHFENPANIFKISTFFYGGFTAVFT